MVHPGQDCRSTELTSDDSWGGRRAWPDPNDKKGEVTARAAWGIGPRTAGRLCGRGLLHGLRLCEHQQASDRTEGRGDAAVPRGPGRTHSGGGGLVLAHTTDLRRPFLCQPCPALRLPSASEIPRERRITVGLSPLNLPRKPERLMEQVRSAWAVLLQGPHAEATLPDVAALCPAERRWGP